MATGAINGRISADGHNPYRAIEVARMPAGEQEAFATAFERDIAGPLGLVVGTPEHTMAWTVGRATWLAAWKREKEAEAASRRAAMAGAVTTLDQGLVVAQVEQLGGTR